MIESAVLELLSADAAITGIVGSNIFYLINQDGGLDSYIVYIDISTNRTGSIDLEAGPTTERYQIDVYAVSSPICVQLADAVVALLHNTKPAAAGIQFQLVELVTKFGRVDNGVFRKTLEFNFYY